MSCTLSKNTWLCIHKNGAEGYDKMTWPPLSEKPVINKGASK